MKPHSPELISDLQSRYESKPTQHYEIGNLAVEYALLDLGDSAPFPMPVFAAFPDILDQPMIASDKNKSGAILVSDDVPEDLQGLWALHEFLDFTMYGHNSHTRCLDSDTLILDTLRLESQQDLAKTYAKARLSFYVDLALLASKDIDDKGIESSFDFYDLSGFKATIDMIFEKEIGI